MRPLPDDLRRLLAVEPRVLEITQAEREAWTYPGIEDRLERLEAHTRRLTGEPGPRALRVTETWWRGEIAPLENPVLIARDCAERHGFPAADVASARAVWLRRAREAEAENSSDKS